MNKKFSFNGEIVELSLIGFVCPVCLSVVKYSCRITPIGPDYEGSNLEKLVVTRVWRAVDGKRGVDTSIPTLMMSHDISGTPIKQNHEVILSFGDDLMHVKLKPSVKVPVNHPMLIAKVFDGRFCTWVYKQAGTKFVFKPDQYRFNPNPCKHCWVIANDRVAGWSLSPITYNDFDGSLGIETGDGMMYEMKYSQLKKNWEIVKTFNDESVDIDKPSMSAMVPLNNDDSEVPGAGYIIIDVNDDEIDFSRSCMTGK